MIESKRLKMRKLEQSDFDQVAQFLMDDEVMYAWEGGYTADGVREFIEKNKLRVERDGCGYLLAEDKAAGQAVGVMGLIYNDVNGKKDWEAAYILRKEAWGKGYAREGACACINYALRALGAKRVIVQMRVENTASEKVAQSLGLSCRGEYTRHYLGKEMPHRVYIAEQECHV